MLEPDDINFASEEPIRPNFPSDDLDCQADDLEFETEDQDEINDFLEKQSTPLMNITIADLETNCADLHKQAFSIKTIARKKQ